MNRTWFVRLFSNTVFVVVLGVCLSIAAFAQAGTGLDGSTSPTDASQVGAVAQLKPFFAPAEPSGKVVVKLYPMENVSPGVAQLVTFGFPFPRGSVTAAGLSKVRVLKNDAEIPAYVRQLTPWRHILNSSLDRQSVRVARVQIHYTFSVGYPNHEEVEIEWGLADRAQDVPTLVTPRSGWHMVTSGTFLAVDRVREPNVYVVLPKELLTKGLFKPMRMEPLDDSIPEPREDPQAVAAVDSWPGFLGQEHAAKNNFHTIINQDDSRVAPAERCDYRNKRTGTNGEPWLYDRSSAMFMLYFRSGFLKPLREAVRSTQFYFNHIDQDGFLNLKDEQDPKYSYNECLAYSFWLTGDNLMRSKIGLIVQSQKDVVSRWSPSLNFWTERHAAFKLLANVVAFEVLGSAGYRTNVRNITQDFVWHQNGAGGQIPEQRIDGGLYHYGRQHAEDWAPDSLGASPWMTALLLDAVVRAYAFLEGPDVADFIRRTGTFEKAGISVTGEHPYDNYEGQLSVPIYAALLDGTVGTAEWEDAEHALDVKSALCWAAYFAKLTGYADPSLKEKAQDLYFTYDNGVRYWIRPDAPKLYGKPAFRVTPWRKYGWEHRISPSNSWIMNQL